MAENGKGNNIIQFVGIIFAIAVGLYGIDHNLGQRMEFMNTQLQGDILHIGKALNKINLRMEEDNVKELSNAKTAARMEAEDVRSTARIIKLEVWQKEWYETIPIRIGKQDTEIEAIKKHVDHCANSPK